MDWPHVRVALDCGAVATLAVHMDARSCRCGAAHVPTAREFALALWMAYQGAELEHATRAARADDESGAR